MAYGIHVGVVAFNCECNALLSAGAFTSLIANAGLPTRMSFSFLKGTKLGWLVSRRSFPASKGECSDHCGWDYQR